MAKISFVIVPSRRNADDTYTIQLKITNVNTTAYIATKFKVMSENQFQNGTVVKHPQSVVINRDLRNLMSEYEEIAESAPSFYSAKQVKKYIEHELNKSDYFLRDFAIGYIGRLRIQGRKSYAQNMEYTLKYVLNKFGDVLRLSDIRANLLLDLENYLRMNLRGYQNFWC